VSDESNRPRSLRRYLLETGAVLSGILIAFGLDAGWGVLQGRDELRESLSALEREFQGARAQLDSVIAVNERAIAASDEFLRMSAADLDSRADEELGAIITGLSRADTFDPGESALNALVSGNNLERIRDPALRDLVAAWSGRVADLREEQVEVRRAEAAIKQQLADSELFVPQLGSDPSSFTARDHLRNRMEAEVIRQLLAVRRGGVGLMLLEQRGLSDATDQILARLHAALQQ